MADPKGFLKHGREVATRRPVEERVQDWNEVYPDGVGPRAAADHHHPGRPLHGLRHPVLPPGLPAGQHHPGVERPGLARRLGRRDRAAARDQQLPGVHRPAVPGAVRDRLRARHQPGPGDDQERRGLDHRPGVGVRLRPAAAARSGSRAARSRSSAPARPASPPPSSSPAPVTRSRSTSAPTRSAGCCATASPSSRWRSSTSTGGSTRCAARARSSGPASTSAPRPHRPSAARPVRRRRARHGRDHAAATCRCPAASSTASTRRWSTCRSPTGSRSARRSTDQIRADGKHVVIIGGGDTGADCLGTAHPPGRGVDHPAGDHAAAAARTRPDGQPWPTYPMTFRVSSAHEEGGDRVYAVSTQEFLGDDDGRVRALRLVEVGRRRSSRSRAPSGRSRPSWCCSPWASPARSSRAWSSSSGSSSTSAATSPATRLRDHRSPGVFVAGDAGRGQSLIVWAIAEGRAAAAAVDRFLTGSTTLPAPIPPTERPICGLTATSGPACWIDPTSLGSGRAKSEDRLHPRPRDRHAGADPRAGRRRAWTSPGST